MQAAIDAVDPGDTIRLCPGSYPAHIWIDKDLTLLGAGAGHKVLDGGGTHSGKAAPAVDSEPHEAPSVR